MTISWREGMDPGSIPVHHLTSVKICLLLPSRDWPIFLLYELWIKHFDIYISLDLLISQAQPRLHPEMQQVFKISTVLLSASGLCHPAPSQLMESYLAPFWQSGTRTQTQKMSLSLLQCWSVVYRLPQTQQQLFEGGRVLGRVNPFLFTPVRPTHCCLHTAHCTIPKSHRSRWLIFSKPNF